MDEHASVREKETENLIVNNYFVDSKSENVKQQLKDNHHNCRSHPQSQTFPICWPPLTKDPVVT